MGKHTKGLARLRTFRLLRVVRFFVLLQTDTEVKMEMVPKYSDNPEVPVIVRHLNCASIIHCSIMKDLKWFSVLCAIVGQNEQRDGDQSGDCLCRGRVSRRESRRVSAHLSLRAWSRPNWLGLDTRRLRQVNRVWLWFH